MTKKIFERDYHISCSRLSWEHYSGLHEVAFVGDYTVYHNLHDDTYLVVLDNSVCHNPYDLGSLLDD